MRTYNFENFKTNELKSDTWKSAYNKSIEHGQIALSKKFKEKWKSEIKLNHQVWIKKNAKKDLQYLIVYREEFKIFVDKYDTNEEFDIIHNKFEPMTILDHTTNHESYEFLIDYPYIIDIEENEVIMEKIVIENNDIHFLLHNNKFINKKEYMKFIKMLNKLYILEDYNRMNKVRAELNGVKVSDVVNGKFHTFINETFGDFETFRNKAIKITSMYNGNN